MNKWKRFISNKKNIVIVVLGVLCVLNIPESGARFLFWVAGGILTCCALGVSLNRIFRKGKVSLQSAVISGFIVSGILDYRLDWHVLVFFAAVAIVSKFVIRIHNRHVFNPANFGLFIASFFKQPLTWNIESNTYVIIAAGIYLALSLHKWPHVLGFVLVFFSAFSLSGFSPFDMISWFFLFIMLIEPKTSGFGIREGLVFGGISGLASFIMFRFIPRIDIFVASLIAANIFSAVIANFRFKKFGPVSVKE